MKRRSFAAAALLLGGCTMAQIEVPTDLASAPRLPVSGMQGFQPQSRITFGPYSAERVRRSATRVREREGAITTTGQHWQDYHFNLAEDGAPAAAVDCAVEALADATSLPGNIEMSGVSRSALECVVDPQGEGRDWSLSLASRGGQPLAGTLSGGGGEAFQVAGTMLRPQDRCCGTAGYHIRRGGRTVGAVEVINHGGVWLHPELGAEDRRLVAATAAALLALQELGDDFTRER